MGHLYHGYVSHNQRVSCYAALLPCDSDFWTFSDQTFVAGWVRKSCHMPRMGGASLHDQLISRKKHGAALISDFLSAKLR